MRIRYQMYHQESNNKWSILAFNEDNQLIAQQIDIIDAATTLETAKNHAGANVVGIYAATLIVDGSG